jgi:hypothetical protein
MIDERFLGSFAVSLPFLHDLAIHSNSPLRFLVNDKIDAFYVTQNLLSFAIIALLIGYHYFTARPQLKRD